MPGGRYFLDKPTEIALIITVLYIILQFNVLLSHYLTSTQIELNSNLYTQEFLKNV